MVWEPEVDELNQRRAMALRMGGDRTVARQHEHGKLTVRERIDVLADPGTFHELGQLAGHGEYEDGKLVDFTPVSMVCGTAEIDGRPVMIQGADFTIRGGAVAVPGPKSKLPGNFAREYRLPFIHLFDSAGASIEHISEIGHTYLPSSFDPFSHIIQHMAEVPVVAAILGTVAGGPAGQAILAHFNVMTKSTSAIFASGPPVVKRALGHDVTNTELGGSQIHTRVSGVVDNEAADEADAFRQVRKFLGFLPSSVWELPPVAESAPAPSTAAEELIGIVPRERMRPYSMHRLIELLVDGGDFFEIQPHYGESLIVGLARVHGHPVGIVANNPLRLGGAMSAASAEKQGRFLELCDQFHIPPIFLVDIPGFMIGTHAEREGTLRQGMRVIWSWAQMRVPMFTLQVRKCYGMAGAITSNASRLNYRVAWPSGEFGSIPIEGGVDAAFRREIAAAPDPKKRRDELEAELNKYRNVFRTAEAMGVEEIIDPRETRDYLVRFVKLAYRSMSYDLGPMTRRGARP
jgi:acetyl-CoA carboxylase carboxyltransferase component